MLEVKGKIPQDLNGYFYRNGPAQNEVYGKRYHHWFDGDGMGINTTLSLIVSCSPLTIKLASLKVGLPKLPTTLFENP
jgi:hypothetical protein